MISNVDLRAIKKAICDRIGLVATAGDVIPTRAFFADKNEYWAMVSPKTRQKALETSGIACSMVYLSVPRRQIDPLNDKVFEMDFTVMMFREGFPTRADETSSPDAFAKQIYLTEELFDTGIVNAAWQFRDEVTISGLSADLKATILPINLADVAIDFGAPEMFPTVNGHFAEFTVTVEAIYDDC
jgi:hypothetical protein